MPATAANSCGSGWTNRHNGQGDHPKKKGISLDVVNREKWAGAEPRPDRMWRRGVPVMTDPLRNPAIAVPIHPAEELAQVLPDARVPFQELLQALAEGGRMIRHRVGALVLGRPVVLAVVLLRGAAGLHLVQTGIAGAELPKGWRLPLRLLEDPLKHGIIL